jgi:hypothetical protein
MKVVSLKSLVAGAALLLACAVAFASADPQQLTIRDIVTQQTQLRAQVAAGKGAFKDMEKRDRAALIERQDRVLATLGGAQTLDEMPPDQRTEIFNDLEWIKAAITKAEDERMVCEYTRAVGSNRMTSVCMTAKQQRENRDGAKDSLRRVYKCDNCAGN